MHAHQFRSCRLLAALANLCVCERDPPHAIVIASLGLTESHNVSALSSGSSFQLC